MRRKTSLTLADAAIAVAQAEAKREGKPLSRWVEQAILNEAARNEVELIEEWERQLSAEERSVLAALDEADRMSDLDA